MTTNATIAPGVVRRFFVHRALDRSGSPLWPFPAMRCLGLVAFAVVVSFASAAAPAAAGPAPDPGSSPAPRLVRLNPALPTLFVAGDSTAARGRGERQQGWAEPFADYFDPAKINIANRAAGGRSSRTFVTEGRWNQILAELKRGDIVLIQFGHNDGGALNDEPPPPLRARGSIPGLGEETREIDNVVTKRHEVVHTFGWYLRKMVADTTAAGATPIVLSPTVRNLWTDGKIEPGPGRYGYWCYEVAKAARIPFVDLGAMMADHFNVLGAEKTQALYPQDHTHFNAVGADLHAAAVVSGLKGLRPSPVAGVLSAKGDTVAADQLVWLRLPAPADRRLPSLFLAGDSTVRNGRGDGAGGQWGWGDYLGSHFDLDRINVVNRAVGGTGARSFRAPGGYWERLLALVKTGDFVMIQFGTNDNGPRGALRGTGEETEARPATKDQPAEIVHTFGWYLRQDIADVRARGATPIICTLVPRKIWRNEKIVRSQASHAGWARQIAAAGKVAFVDLNELIAARYDALGEANVNTLFADEHTHTSAAGAELSAEVVVAGLRALPENPLARFLRSVP